MKKVELEVINITQGFTQHHSYAVVLGEVKGKRRLPIVIGAAEAQAIAVSLENMTPARPLTHDLLKSMMDTFHVHLSEVVITNLMDGIFIPN
ncbi:MAG: bifunctional nuclease family protein [Chitinophagales bacterium]